MNWWIDESYYPGPSVQESELQLAGSLWNHPGVTYVSSRYIQLSPSTSHPRGIIVNCAKGSITSFTIYNDINGIREYTEHRFFYNG